MSCFQNLLISVWILLVIVNVEFCLAVWTCDPFDQNEIYHFLLLAVSVFGFLFTLGTLLTKNCFWILITLTAFLNYLISSWRLFILITQNGNYEQSKVDLQNIIFIKFAKEIVFFVAKKLKTNSINWSMFSFHKVFQNIMQFHSNCLFLCFCRLEAF